MDWFCPGWYGVPCRKDRKLPIFTARRLYSWLTFGPGKVFANMTLQIVQTLPTDQWQAFVDGHPKGNIFHTPEMFQVFFHAKGHDPELWAAVNDDQILALFIPVRISLQSGYLRRLTTRAVSFGSVLAAYGEAGDQALRLILREYINTSGRQSLFTELRNISPLENWLPVLLEQGFAYEEHLNYIIHLDPLVDNIFENIGKRTRRNIKRGINKALVKIEEVDKKSDLMTCYRLLDMTYRAAHVPLAEYSLFESAFDILGPKGMIRFALAKVGENSAAASVELLYKDVLFGWYGGMDRAYAPYVPNELLMWNILKWGAENGFKKYDFGGAGKPNEKYGVRDFKAKFGGDLVCYGRNVWVPNPPLMSLGKFAYQAVRRLFY